MSWVPISVYVFCVSDQSSKYRHDATSRGNLILFIQDEYKVSDKNVRWCVTKAETRHDGLMTKDWMYDIAVISAVDGERSCNESAVNPCILDGNQFGCSPSHPICDVAIVIATKISRNTYACLGVFCGTHFFILRALV